MKQQRVHEISINLITKGCSVLKLKLIKPRRWCSSLFFFSCMSNHIKSPKGSYVWCHSETRFSSNLMTFGVLTFNLMEEDSVLVMQTHEQKSLHIQCVIMTIFQAWLGLDCVVCCPSCCYQSSLNGFESLDNGIDLFTGLYRSRFHAYSYSKMQPLVF